MTLSQATDHPVPVIIDTDTAQDDCIAILVGLLDPGADLLAITMVAGNVGFEQQVANAQLTLNCRRDARSGAGACRLPAAPAAGMGVCDRRPR